MMIWSSDDRGCSLRTAKGGGVRPYRGGVDVEPIEIKSGRLASTARPICCADAARLTPPLRTCSARQARKTATWCR